MPRDRSDAAAIVDILECAQKVLRYTSGKSRDDYEREDLLRDAVERNIEIIGEAARRLSDGFRLAHPEIPWREIMGTRHIIAHDYDEIDNEIVWDIVTHHIPVLVNGLRPFLPPPPPA